MISEWCTSGPDKFSHSVCTQWGMVSRHKKVVPRKKNFQVIFWNYRDFLKIYRKWIQWIPWEILWYLEAKIMAIWRREVILWAKQCTRKLSCTWKLSFAVISSIFSQFRCSFFLNIMFFRKEFKEHSEKGWNTIFLARNLKNRIFAPANTYLEISIVTFLVHKMNSIIYHVTYISTYGKCGSILDAPIPLLLSLHPG